MNNDFGDSDFLAIRDIAADDFRKSGKETKHQVIEKMIELRHNMKYNKHLLSVYMKAKGIFDTMVEEHRNQLQYLEEIYRHINNIIRENLVTLKPTRSSIKNNGILTELMKDKKRIGLLLKKMRTSYEKLTNIDTVIGVSIDKIQEITFMDDNENIDDDDAESAEYGDTEGEDEDTEDEDPEGEEGDDEDEDTEDEDDDIEGEDEEGEDEEGEDEDEDIDDIEDIEGEDEEGEDEDEEDDTEEDDTEETDEDDPEGEDEDDPEEDVEDEDTEEDDPEGEDEDDPEGEVILIY